MRSLGRGALIVIEGVDRSGKSTQCRKLVESLRSKNIKTELINFPDRTTLTGKLISEYLKNRNCKLNDQAIHLLFSANRWENVEKMKSLLNSGTTIIVDRYSYSGIAYSAAKGGMDISWCKQSDNGLPKPDLVFLLTLSYKEAASRSGFGEERYENNAMQERVASVFLQLAKEEDNWRVIDANDSVESLHELLLEGVLNKVSQVALKDQQTLQIHS